jgi:hypothetical protein
VVSEFWAPGARTLEQTVKRLIIRRLRRARAELSARAQTPNPTITLRTPAIRPAGSSTASARRAGATGSVKYRPPTSAADASAGDQVRRSSDCPWPRRSQARFQGGPSADEWGVAPAAAAQQTGHGLRCHPRPLPAARLDHVVIRSGDLVRQVNARRAGRLPPGRPAAPPAPPARRPERRAAYGVVPGAARGRRKAGDQLPSADLTSRSLKVSLHPVG